MPDGSLDTINSQRNIINKKYEVSENCLHKPNRNIVCKTPVNKN